MIALTRAGPCLLLSACGAHISEASVQRENVIVRCTVIGRGAAAAAGIAVGGGLVRPERATFNFRTMSFKIDQLEGRIVSTAFLVDGRRTAELTGPAVVTFPPPGGIGHIVFDGGARVDEIRCRARPR